MTPTETTDESTGVDQHPEEQYQGDEESPYGKNNEDLPEQLIKALKFIVEDVQSQDGYHKYLRRMEDMRDWRNRLYDRGIQHIRWTNGRGEGGGGYAVITPGGWSQNSAGVDVQAPRFCDAWNIVSPYMSILTAVQTQDAPDIAFRPEDESDPDDIDAAKEAEGYRGCFDRRNNVTDIDVRLFRMLALSGRTIAWTRTETDPQKFGYDENNQPRMFQTTTVFGTIESRVPILAKGQENCHYCALIDDLDVNVLKSRYPDIKDEIKEGEKAIGESAYERMARLGVMQNTGGVRGNAFSQLSALANWWLRPSCFCEKSFSEAFDDNPSMTVEEALNKLFPLGVHVVFVGDVYAGSWKESMDDCLTIRGGPMSQDGMYQQALIDPIIVVQDALNDGKNTARLVWEVCWPATYFASEDEEYDAVVNQRASPGNIHQMKDLPSGQDAASRFFREPDTEVPDSFMKWLADLEGPFPQFQLGSPPALFGGADPKVETAAGQAQAKNQALGMQGNTFKVKEEMWASIYRQAALAAARSGSEESLVSSKGGVARKIDLQKIEQGRFMAYPDRDSGFPESTAAKRQIMQHLIVTAGTSPQGQQIFDAPRNWKVMLSLNGFPELEVPEAEAWEKQIGEIEQLLKNAPVPPDPEVVQQLQEQHAAQALQANETGQPIPPFAPPPPKSTITPDPLDFHLWEFNACQDWLSGSDCRRELARENQAGVANVRAHALEHWQMKSTVPWNQPPPLPVPMKVPPAQPGLGVPRAISATPAPQVA